MKVTMSWLCWFYREDKRTIYISLAHVVLTWRRRMKVMMSWLCWFYREDKRTSASHFSNEPYNSIFIELYYIIRRLERDK